jgi:hypothetical protein
MQVFMRQLAIDAIEDVKSWTTWVPQAHAKATDTETFLPYTCNHVWDCLKRLIEKSSGDCRLWATFDGTHDVCKELFKELGFGIVATRWDSHHGEYMATDLDIMKAIAHAEDAPSIRALVKSAKEVALSKGIDLEKIIESFSLDGNPAAMLVFKAEFPNAKGRLDLQHAKKRGKLHFPGGFGAHVSNFMDMVAFQPPLLAHANIVLFIEKLKSAGRHKGVEYLLAHQFQIVDDLFTAPWQSSCHSASPCGSLFSSKWSVC